MSALNNSLLLGQEGGGGYSISRSLRFNSSDSAYLSRTPASAGNRKTWTWAGWVKRSRLTSISGTEHTLFSGGTGSNDATICFDNAANGCLFFYYYTSTYVAAVRTTQFFRDPSAWYHIVVAVDTTQAVVANRVLMYVNGTAVSSYSSPTYPPQSTDMGINTVSTTHAVGARNTLNNHFDGYLADIHFIDGQALDPTSFGEFSATTGVWMPKAYSGTYGTNGFKLDFSDNSAATATTLGKDSSGNGNNWTPNNLSVTAGAGNDSLVDVPTNGSEVDTGLGGQVRGNYCTWNPLKSTVTLSNGNLDGSAGGGWFNVAGTIAVTSGKWYWEVTMNTSTYVTIGVATPEASLSESYGSPTSAWVYDGRGTKQGNGSGNAGSGTDTYGASYAAGDVIGVALDMDNGTLTFYKNNTSQGTAFSTGLSGKTVTPWHGLWSSSSSTNWGARPFAYTAPSGFKALCTANLPAPVVTKPSTVMDVKLYTGNGSTQTISGLEFSPDFIWVKNRTRGTANHALYDIVRGRDPVLASNTTGAELTGASSSQDLTSFNSDGFSLGTVWNADLNRSAEPYVAWAWDAGSSTVTNTQGSISSQVRANASAGFSIVTYTGNGTNGATVGHGLGVAPEFFIFKQRSVSGNWIVVHKSIPYPWNNYSLRLNTTDAVNGSQGTFGNVAPTSSVFTLWASSGTPTTNANTETYIAYCFAPVAGYSSFGSYTGNGNADGPFVYTGFRPRFLMIKASSFSTEWLMLDTSRSDFNFVNDRLQANSSAAEDNVADLDIVSNGFKMRSALMNNNAATFIYCAFAESPFQYARAR